MRWSRIQNTELAQMLRNRIQENTVRYNLYYHNLEHVSSIYDYFDATGEPYRESTDWAVLAHDVIYDPESEKELRSAEWFIELAQDRNMSRGLWGDVYYEVMATVNHEVTDPRHSAMVRGDLHQLIQPLTVYVNHGKIIRESMSLYNKDMITCIQGNNAYMQAMADRISGNQYSDPEHRYFWQQVHAGVRMTCAINELALGKLHNLS